MQVGTVDPVIPVVLVSRLEAVHGRGGICVMKAYLSGGLIHVAHVTLLGEQHTGVVHLLKLERNGWRVGCGHLPGNL